jgi:hypothetical protein
MREDQPWLCCQGSRKREGNKTHLLAGNLVHLPHKAAGVPEESLDGALLLAANLVHLPHKAAGVEEERLRRDLF